MQYLTTPEYRAHAGCTHPVHDHSNRGCLTHGCRCKTPRRDLAAPSGIRQVADWALRGIGLIWVLVHAYGVIAWFVE